MASALTDSIAASGQTQPSANLPMNGKLHTNVAEGTARNHYAAVSQIQDGGLTTLGTVAGTDTITAALTPSVETPGLTAGMLVKFEPANTNTGAVTIAINSLDAVAIQKFGSTALAAGDLVAGVPAAMIYDGTAFQLLNPQKIGDAALSSNVPLLNAQNDFSAVQQGPNGSASTPTWSFTGDPDLGIYRVGTNNLGISAGNSAVAQFSQSEIDLTATTLDFNGAADFSGVATFSASGAGASAAVRIVSASPSIVLSESDAPEDEGNYELISGGGTLVLRTRTNADATGENIMVVGTTGSAVDTVTFSNGAVDVVESFTAGTIASDGALVGSIPTQNEDGNFTTGPAERGKLIYKDSGGSGETYTIDGSDYSAGDFLVFVNQGGGTLSIVLQDDSMTQMGTGGTSDFVLQDDSMACAIKITSSTWVISGAGLSSS